MLKCTKILQYISNQKKNLVNNRYEVKSCSNSNSIVCKALRKNNMLIYSDKLTMNDRNHIVPSVSLHATSNSTLYDHKNLKNQSNNTKIQSYLKIMRLDKPQAIIFVASPALWTLGFMTENGCLLDYILLLKLMFGSLFTRTAQCVLNDYIDSDIDKKVKRTMNRPLATNSLSTTEVVIIALAMLTASLIVLLSLPIQCFPYGVAGAIGMILYPFSKRYIKIPSLILASVNALGIPIVYKALHMNVDYQSAIPLTLAYITYTIVYEAIYSYQDLIDDKKLNINSFARFVEHEKAKFVLASLMIVSLLSLVVCGYVTEKNWPFYLSVLVGSIYIIPIFKGSINFALIIFLGLVIDLYYRMRNLLRIMISLSAVRLPCCLYDSSYCRQYFKCINQNYFFIQISTLSDSKKNKFNINQINNPPKFKLNPKIQHHINIPQKPWTYKEKLILYRNFILKTCNLHHIQETFLLSVPSLWTLISYNHNYEIMSYGNIWLNMASLFTIINLLKIALLPSVYLLDSLLLVDKKILNKDKPLILPPMIVKINENIQISYFEVCFISQVLGSLAVIFTYLTKLNTHINNCELNMAIILVLGYIRKFYPTNIQIFLKYLLIFCSCLLGYMLIEKEVDMNLLVDHGIIFLCNGLIYEIVKSVSISKIKTLKNIPLLTYLLLINSLCIIGWKIMDITSKNNNPLLGIQFISILTAISLSQLYFCMNANVKELIFKPPFGLNLMTINCLVITILLFLNQKFKREKLNN